MYILPGQILGKNSGMKIETFLSLIVEHMVKILKHRLPE